ncbi:AMP-binding protein [Raineyella sp. LH-20]|uniref:AMP-binding protein n=1 Tax=Raineyella sp. LH-20 TaxID=3081204 RepID=UPI002953208F|nr:AMP-binding protein [Raineyella sp. LH-20]WOP19047.1 AMP-binding protein [Raineyella sp. LH-20]
MSTPPLRLLPMAGLDAEELTEAFAGALDGSYVLAPLPPDPVEEAAVRAMLATAGRPGAVPDGVALIVSTSGSTGTPKGVMLSAAAIRAGAAATDDRIGGPGDWSLALGAHYVAGAMVVCRALLAGTALHLAPPHLDAPRIADLTAAAGPDVRHYLSVVPTQLARLLDDDAALAALARFDAILLGGAAVAPELLADLRARGLRIVTTYGMSETSGGCVYDGRPLAGVEVRVETAAVADPDHAAPDRADPNRPDPDHAAPDHADPDRASAGRLTITGPMVFSGYLGRPDLTAEVLRIGPSGRRTLLTGDRGEIAPDGSVRVLGRLDDVVISGGLNVDLAAVQTAARRALGTTDLVALGVTDEIWGTRVVVVTTVRTSLPDLRTVLAPVLAHHALPRGLARLDVLPTTSSGKIDRRALIAAWGTMDEELA